MTEFNINTPQRIAAFLAQVKQECTGLKKLQEDIGPYQVGIILKTFVSGFTYDKPNRADETANRYCADQIINRKTLEILNAQQAAATSAADKRTLSERQARFYNLKAFFHDDLGLSDMDGMTITDQDVVVYAATNASAETVTLGEGHWTQALADKFADRVYSDDVGLGENNGKLADKTAHYWS